MELKEFRPLTPTQRFKSLPAFDEITKWRPEKSLLQPKKRSGGRNNRGRLTSRHIGGGHKQKYRKVDFKRRKYGIAAEVIGIEYDPNRSARIALIKYADGELSYILAPSGLKVGATVNAGNDVAPDLGNSLPLRAIPLGTNVHNIELTPGRGGQVARSAGQQATLTALEAGYALVKMPSGEIRRIHETCFATIGQVGNVDHMNVFERQSRTYSLARPTTACARHGDEPHRSPDGWRPREIKRRRWSPSSGQSMGAIGERL